MASVDDVSPARRGIGAGGPAALCLVALLVVVTGEKNADSSGVGVMVDAFDVVE